MSSMFGGGLTLPGFNPFRPPPDKDAGTPERRDGALTELTTFTEWLNQNGGENWRSNPNFVQSYNDRVRNYILWNASSLINSGDISTAQELEDYFSSQLNEVDGSVDEYFTADEVETLLSEGFEGIEDRAEFLENYAERLENRINMQNMMETLAESGINPDISRGMGYGGDASAIAASLGFDYDSPQPMNVWASQSDEYSDVMSFNASDESKADVGGDAGTTTPGTGQDESSFPTSYQGPESQFQAGFGNTSEYGPNPYMVEHGDPDPRKPIMDRLRSGGLSSLEAMYLLSQGGNTLPTDENIASAREAISQQMYDLSDPTVMKQLMTFAASVGMDYGTVIDNAVNHNAYYFEGQEQPDPNFNWIYETEPRNEAEEWLYQTLSDTFPEDAYFNDEAPTSDEQDQDAANDFFEDKSDSGPRPGEDKKDSEDTETPETGTTTPDTGAATTMTLDEIQGLIDTSIEAAFEGLETPLTEEQYRAIAEDIVAGAISEIPADTQISTEDLNTAIGNYVTENGYLTEDQLPDFQAMIDASLPDTSGFLTAADLPDTSGFLTADDLRDLPQEDTVRSDEDIQGLIDAAVSDFITASDLPEDQVRTDEDIQGLIDAAIQAIPADTTRSDEDINNLISTAIDNLDLPEDTTRSDEDIQSLIDASLAGLPEDQVRTDDEIQSLIDAAVSNFVTEDGLPADQVRTDDEIQSLIDAAIEAIPADTTRSDEEINELIDTAISNLELPEDTTRSDEDIQALIDASLEALPEDQVRTDQEIQDIVLENISLEDLGGLSSEDISKLIETNTLSEADIQSLVDVSTDAVRKDYESALSDLETNYAEDFAALEEQFAGDIEGLQSAIDDLDTNFQSDLENLQSSVDERVSGLETSFNQDLSDLRTDLEGDVADIVGDVEGVETDIEQIEGDIGDIESEITDIDDRLDILNNTFQELYDDLEQKYNSDMEAINSTITDVTERTEALEERDGQFQEDLSALQVAYEDAINSAQTETEEEFRETLEGYVSSEALEQTLEGYVTQEGLEGTLSDYVSQTQNQYESLVSEYQDLRDDLQNADNQYEVDALTTQLDDLQNQIDSFLGETGYDPTTGYVDPPTGGGGGDGGTGQPPSDGSGGTGDGGTGDGGTGDGGTGDGGTGGGGERPDIPEEDTGGRTYPYPPRPDPLPRTKGGWGPIRYTADPLYQYGQPNITEKGPLEGITSLTQPFNPPSYDDDDFIVRRPIMPSPPEDNIPRIPSPGDPADPYFERLYSQGGIVDPNMSMNQMMGQAGGIQSLTNFQTNVSPFQQAFRPNVRRYN